jgi:hypothetical protein
MLLPMPFSDVLVTQRSTLELTVMSSWRDPDPLSAAAGRVARLALAVAGLGEVDVGAALSGTPGGAAAADLAGELARVLPCPPQPDRTAAGRPLAQYLDALRDAAQAVYYCRRVQHAAGGCWFSIQGPRHDVCGRILVTAHLLDAAPQRADQTGAPR